MDVLVKEEYEIQHYGCSLRMLHNMVHGTVEDAITETIMKVEAEMLLANPDRPESDKEIAKNDLLNLKSKYMEASKQPVLNVIKTIDEVMTIPDNVVIGIDKMYEQYKDVNLADLEKEVAQLEKQYVGQKHYKAALLVKQKEMEMLEPINQSVFELLEKLEQSSLTLSKLKKISDEQKNVQEYVQEHLKTNCVAENFKEKL